MPWWYARLFTILYAEPETYAHEQAPVSPSPSHPATEHDGVWNSTYLVFADADVIPVVHARIDAEGTHRTEDDLRSSVPVEGRAREMDREVGVPEVLHPTAHRHNASAEQKCLEENVRGTLSRLHSASGSTARPCGATPPYSPPSTGSGSVRSRRTAHRGRAAAAAPSAACV